jgi:hypothetical protein
VGLAIVDAVANLKSSQRLQVRLGLATGLAVVGETIGAGSAQEQAVVGETPNLAARLQALAAPNGIIIAEATRRQIGGLFELRDLGPQSLKGFSGTLRAWEVLGESTIASRFEALRSRSAPLVGREEEIELLLRRWNRAKNGEGSIVLISADPGIGKSRLTEALEEHIAKEPHQRLRYFCSPHHQDSAFYPFIGHLEHAARFARDDDADARQRKLTEFAATFGVRNDELPLLADLLSLAGTGSIPNPELTPQRKKEKTFDLLIRGLEVLARQQPVLMVFEDLHWIDPTSRELLDLTLARIEQLPVLLIATFRPEFHPPWSGQPQVTMMTLPRLGRREGATLVRELAGNAAALPTDLVDEIIERTDGVPLFLEELTKAMLEAAETPDEGRSAISSPGQRTAVPATLQASLMARLDRLGPAARDGADGSGNRTRIFLRHNQRSSRASGGGCRHRARSSCRFRPCISAWHAACGRLPFQARLGARHGLCHVVARAAAGTAWAHRHRHRKSNSRASRARAGNPRLSLERSRQCSARGRLLARSGTARGDAIRKSRSRSAS